MKIAVGIFVAFICGLGIGFSVEDKSSLSTPDVVVQTIKATPACPTINQSNEPEKTQFPVQANEKPKHDSLDELLILATQPEQQIVDPFSQLVDKISSDANARSRVLQALKQESDSTKRARLLSALGFVDTPDVIATATEFTTQSDSSVRADGYNLLRAAQLTSPTARATLLNSLTQEENETALATAVSALMPESNPSNEDRTAVVAELNKLNQHTSPKVRAEVVLAMSRWNPASTQTENMIQGALNSSDADLRDSALTALIENPIRNDQMKASLVNLVSNAQLDSLTRWRALDTVGNYNLTEKERQTVALARQSLPAPEY